MIKYYKGDNQVKSIFVCLTSHCYSPNLVNNNVMLNNKKVTAETEKNVNSA